MAINFIPNDPLARNALPMRQQAPRPDRGTTLARFGMAGAVAPGLYPPGTAEFLFWQCREAALAAVDTWEILEGPLRQWSPYAISRKRLPLHPNDGDDLNAYYDRQSVSFFAHTTGGKTTFSGASTDVVAHECGHALLDSIRPDLWDSPFVEVAALHEAFGDCMALLTAFADPPTRRALLVVSPDLATSNFVEATAEDLSDGVRRDPRLGPRHPAAAPRHALNSFRWRLPTTLPTSGPPPVLTSEIHSFGRVFSGCFYDTVRNIFTSSPARTEVALWAAVRTAGKLLIRGAREAPLRPRFFQSVGRAMVLADRTLNAGANRQAIGDAFSRHAIALGSAAMLAPTASLAGPAPRLGARRASLSMATRGDLLRRIGARPGARLSVRARKVGGSTVVSAVHYREVPLQSVSRRLKGVVAVVPESTLVGAAGTRAAVLGALPEATSTADEVHAFVEMLMEHDGIAFEGAAPAARRAAAGRGPTRELPTHAIRLMGRKKVLSRLRFASCPGRLVRYPTGLAMEW